ncbi:MAG: TolC family protein [Candidatus Brocadiia bacterium]
MSGATLRRGPVMLLVAGLWALGPGCTPTYYKRDADREVYGILRSPRAQALGTPSGFRIDPSEQTALEALLAEQGEGADAPQPSERAMADLDPAKVPGGLPRGEGALRLSLRDALALAAEHSRDYQTAKETLYQAALALTLERFKWTPQWSAGGSVTGTDEKTLNDVRGENTLEGSSSLSVSQLLALGGEVSVNLATDLMRLTNAEPTKSAASVLTIEVLQPLWRNAGRLVARETLTQAERDTLYAVRDFARFRKSFCVDITSSYYRVLQQRDAVMNQWSNWQRIHISRIQTEGLEKNGLVAGFQVDQARQDELSARASWIRALQEYQQQLDQFKIALALPTEAAIELDPGEIERLREAGLGDPGLDRQEAVRAALSRRLDLLTAFDRVGDAERKVVLARNGLGPDVDLRLAASVPSRKELKPLKLPFHRGVYSAALDFDLPLQRKEERNAYRQALINLHSAGRAAQEFRDQVALSVRQDWRDLQEAAESYRIQRDSVELAQRRVRSTSLLLQRGEAVPRDLLEANAALVAAQNALTRTLIDHTLSRLALWRDTEVLQVDENGIWQEFQNGQE